MDSLPDLREALKHVVADATAGLNPEEVEVFHGVLAAAARNLSDTEEERQAKLKLLVERVVR